MDERERCRGCFAGRVCEGEADRRSGMAVQGAGGSAGAFAEGLEAGGDSDGEEEVGSWLLSRAIK